VVALLGTAAEGSRQQASAHPTPDEDRPERDRRLVDPVDRAVLGALDPPVVLRWAGMRPEGDPFDSAS
jgi:hypothetical protein